MIPPCSSTNVQSALSCTYVAETVPYGFPDEISPERNQCERTGAHRHPITGSTRQACEAAECYVSTDRLDGSANPGAQEVRPLLLAVTGSLFFISPVQILSPGP